MAPLLNLINIYAESYENYDFMSPALMGILESFRRVEEAEVGSVRAEPARPAILPKRRLLCSYQHVQGTGGETVQRHG